MPGSDARSVVATEAAAEAEAEAEAVAVVGGAVRPDAHSPSPVISSYEDDKSLCGAGPTTVLYVSQLNVGKVIGKGGATIKVGVFA